MSRFTQVACATAALIFTAMFVQAGTALAAPPANDNRASAEVLENTTPSLEGTNAEATGEAGEPDHAGASSPNPSVWFKWTAPASGRWTVNVCASNYDTTLAVYGAGSSTSVVSNNNGCGRDNGSFVVFNATAGTTYDIAVSGAAGATGTIDGFMIQAPANDQFGAARVLSGKDPARLIGTTKGATGEASEPNHAAISLLTGCSSATSPSPFCQASVWFTWKAPTRGRYAFSTCGSEFDTTLAVYTGNSVAALKASGANDDGCQENRSLLYLDVTAGTTYRIALAGYAGRPGISPDVGQYALDISPGPVDTAFAGVTPKFGKSIVVRKWKAKFKLLSPEAASGTLSAKSVKKFRAPGAKKLRKKKKVFFGRVKFNLKAGIAKTVTLKLNKAGRALLKKKRSVKVLITIAAKDTAGNPKTTTKRVTLKLLGKSIVVKKGKAKFKLLSPEAASGTLSAKTVKKFTAAGAKEPRKKKVFLGKVKFNLKAGVAKTVTLKLNKAGRALLKRKRSVKALITITTKDAAGNPKTKTKTVTLKLPKKKGKK